MSDLRVTEDDAREALDRYGDMLSKYPHVRGMGVGEIERGGQSTGELSVRVYVEKKLPLEQLDPKHVLPRRLKIELGGGLSKEVPVDVVELQGMLRSDHMP